MAHSFDYDIIIIGAGPGGYVAAIRAAQLKQRVAVIEADSVGGVCLNIGCIPSKSLLHQAEKFRSVHELQKFGIVTDTSTFDYSSVVAQSRKAAAMLSKGVAYLLKKNGVSLFSGKGTIVSAHEISINESKVLSANTIIIATGSHPRPLSGFPVDEKRILTSTGALLLQELPKKLCIIGSGAIGVEFATIMSSFGVSVHIVEIMDHILPGEDYEVSKLLLKLLVKQGITVSTETSATQVTTSLNNCDITLEDKGSTVHSITCDSVLIVTGRVPNSSDIGLENIDITPDAHGCIPVGDYYQTSCTGVYAIGDVIASPQLAHVASREGEIAVEHICGLPSKPTIDLSLIPSGIYCEPQIAHFGINEQEGRAAAIPFKKTILPLRAVGKAVATESSEGFIKLLTDPTDKKLLGAHIIGPQATELIHELLLQKTTDVPLSSIGTMIHGHPTLSEGIIEAVKAVDNRAIHI